ncbi:hypothetical protein K2173_006766 [Erythroxylum novogranatense]|uniref:Protein PHYTOCHROME KINASE SUBSTRATE 4 n=1 Tax=Erythroxylum novogranatense TaxID=1862640 RepID=A0AAV8SXP1_9ROSI|nr:hypothetical protein K2173_006766 [Erythroxylum novogranatense]
MERSTVMKMKTIAGGLSHQKPILFDRVEPSPTYIPFPKKNTVRDASFSAYLKPDELNNQADDSEISIFDAQKYFNESGSAGDPRSIKRVSPVHVHRVNLGRISESCDYSSVPRFSSASSSVDGYGRNYRARSFHATPTSSSEASWNSQTGLLSNPPGAIAVSMRNPSPGDHGKKRMSATKWLLRTRCPCSGKKSVQVEDKQSEPRTPSRLSHMSKVSLDPKKQIPAGNGHNYDTTVVVPSSKWGRECVESGNERVINLVTPDHWLENREPVSTTLRISAEHGRSFSSNHQVLAPGTGRPFTDGNVTSATSGFTFPILTQTTTLVRPPLLSNGLSSTNAIHFNPSLEDPPRDSLEIFRPTEDPVSTKPTSTTGLHGRQSFTFPASPMSRIISATDDDMASDASSDLFEIESFSTQTTSNHPMYSINRRDSLDEASNFNARRLTVTNGGSLYCRRSLEESMTPSVAATECYEPSEASIDWSVTTAEGFDRASVTNFSVTASEAAVDVETSAIRQRREAEKNGGGGGGKRTKGGMINGGLLSCRCEKAVSVGPQPVKCGGLEGQRVVNSTTKHVSSRPTAMVNKPPLAHSHSARLSLPFQP